ncbi:MAG: insulinase family protein [Gemmatimonadetes bacterium]|nr:insulinase family protein [Gemmatimonadota bacterium]
MTLRPPSAACLLAAVVAAAVAAPGQAPAQTAPPAQAAPTPGERLPVQERTLDNGLRVLVLRRQGAPTVSFVLLYQVGGVDEHLGTTGTTHLLEHLLFKGTTTVGTRNINAERALYARQDAAEDTLIRDRALGDSASVARLSAFITALGDSAGAYVVPNEYSRILTRAGAESLNATTTNESTIYYVELPSNRARLWFVLEGDLMRNAVFREFYTERNVVTEERRMRIDTNPAGLLDEAELAAAYTVHPYRQPVVGYTSDLENLTRRDVRDYYRRFYGPNNAVLAVVGDVDPAKVVAWADEYLGPVPRGEDPPPVLAREPPQRGERRVVVRWDAQPQLRIGWHVPSVYDPDAPALEMLTSLLTGGRTSRLYRRLVEGDRLAASVTSSIGPGDRYPRLFEVAATPRAPHTTAEVEAAIYRELARLAADGPTPSELERVKNQVAAGSLRRLVSNLGLAFQLAQSTSLYGDWRETFRFATRLGAVTPADVRRVTARYFTQENRTVATLVREQGGS